jgi:DNA-binding CsgD family transcriptional regulator
LAALWATGSRAAAATRLLGAAAATREAIGAPVPPVDRPALEQAMASARTTLGTAQFDAAWTAGQGLSLEDVVAEALQLVAQPTPADPAATFGLSRREREVLGMLAQRLTDPEIAERLFLSVRTVEGHVTSIRNKLGVDSRREAAALAARYRLV